MICVMMLKLVKMYLSDERFVYLQQKPKLAQIQIVYRQNSVQVLIIRRPRAGVGGGQPQTIMVAKF